MNGTTTLVRLRWSYVTDAVGDLVRTGDPATTQITGCTVMPRISYGGETVEPARHGIVIGLTVYAPLSADVNAATDQVVYRGATYEVEGEVGRWESPYGSRIDGIEFALRRAIG